MTCVLWCADRVSRYIGWTDVPLTELGERDAREAGETLRAAGLKLDVVYTSYLKW